MALGENTELRKLQNGASVTPWQDNQERVTGTCDTKKALTVCDLLVFLVQLQKHRN